MTLPPVQHGSHHPPRAQAKPAHPVERRDRGFGRIMEMVRHSRQASGTPPPAGGDDEADGRDYALIFNQDGYFGAAGSEEFEPGLSQTESDAAVPPGEIAAEGTIDELPESPLGGIEPPPTLSESRVFSVPQYLPATDRRNENGGAKASLVRPSGVAGKPAQAGMTDAAMLALAEAIAPEPPEVREADPAGPKPVRTPRDPAGGGSPVNICVSLGPLGESLDISVRLGGLSGRQRAQLRLEIARLLSRYGFDVGEILLDGTVEPSRRL